MLKKITLQDKKVYFSILKNYTAQVFGLTVTLLNQLLLVPIFIEEWGVEKYADWIIISALSSFFALSNFGINQSSNNFFCFSYHSGDYLKCKKIIHNSILFVSVISSVALILLLVGGIVFRYGKLLDISEFTERETLYIFIFFLINIFLKMLGGVFSGIYRALSKSHYNAYIDSLVVVFEMFFVIGAIYMNLNVYLLLILYNIPVVLGIIIRYRQSNGWFQIGRVQDVKFDREIFKKLVTPSLGFMLMPVGQSLSNQGLIILIKTLLGSDALVSFTTTRTLVNIVKSVTNIFSNSASPEISNLYGKGDVNSIVSVFVKVLLVSLIAALAVSIGLLFWGENIYRYWTKNEVFFDTTFFYTMLLFLIISIFGNAVSSVLFSTNNHKKYSLFFFSNQVLIMASIYLILPKVKDLIMVAITLIFFEIFIVIYSGLQLKLLLIKKYDS